MSKLTRRHFIKSVTAATTVLGTTGFPAILSTQSRTRPLPIAYSTLGCPKWEWKTILDQASRNGYAALELRGLLADVDITKSPQFTGAKLKESISDLAALNIKVSDLGASSRLGEPDPAKRAAQIDEAKRYIDLAHEMKSPYVRVFGGKLVPGQSMDAAIETIVAGFKAMHEYARGSGVTLLLESHDEFCESKSLSSILKGINLPTAQLLWDAHHTFVSGKEKPADTYSQLGRYARHTHLKDSVPEKGTDPAARRYVLTGTGEVPVRDVVKVLVANKYKGYYCFEWEKRWHPTIEEPEVSIPHYAKVMREYLVEAGYKA
jgi:sugar phosphate isomerase/epimerase